MKTCQTCKLHGSLDFNNNIYSLLDFTQNLFLHLIKLYSIAYCVIESVFKFDEFSVYYTQIKRVDKCVRGKNLSDNYEII